jgi:CRP/FNR family transcriptional regulator, cyclic AMP receptor protein
MIELLKRTDLFYNLSDEQLHLIATLAHERVAGAGELIYAEGSSGREVYVIIEGSVEVSHRNHNSGENLAEAIILASLTHGQSFGEIAFIDGALREASVIAVTPNTRLLVIGADALMAQCEANPALGFFIIRNIARDLAFIVRDLDLHMLGEIYWGSATLGSDPESN